MPFFRAFVPASMACVSIVVLLLSMSSASLSSISSQELAVPKSSEFSGELRQTTFRLRRFPVLALRGGAEVQDEPAQQVPQEPIPPDPHKVYIGNLPQKVSDEALKEFLSVAGEIVEINVKRYKSTGQCKGYALAKFASEEAASNAIRTLAGGSFANRSVMVKPDAGFDPEQAEKRRKYREAKAAEGQQRKRVSLGHPKFWPRCPVERRVYVGNIKFGTSWQEVRDLMASAGHVEFGRIVKTPTTLQDGSVRHVSKGFAIVHYADAAAAKAAVETLNGTELNGRPLRIQHDVGRRLKEGDEQPLEEDMANLNVAGGQGVGASAI